MSNSLDIEFIPGDIHSQSRENAFYGSNDHKCKY